jgi:hypothetical protein
MTEREKRLLEVIGEDVMEEIKRRDSVGLAGAGSLSGDHGRPLAASRGQPTALSPQGFIMTGFGRP